jgi:hypothetical protein
MGTTGKRTTNRKIGKVLIVLACVVASFIGGIACARTTLSTDWQGVLTFGKETHGMDPGIILQETIFETVYEKDIIIGLREDGCLVWKWAPNDSKGVR